MLQITKNYAGAPLEVSVGESFELRLPENPTTGYRWTLRSNGQPVVELQADSFETSAGLCGAGGTHIWRFRASQAGVGELATDLRRSWEKRATETFNVSVQVKPAQPTN